MANTNAQAILFANTRIRPFADELYSTYLTAKSLLNQWNAQSVSTAIPNDSTVIADGSATDGRAPIIDAQATNIITRAQELVNWMEADSLTGGTVTNAVLNTVVAVAVNPQSKF